MSIEELFNYVETAITAYEDCCQKEAELMEELNLCAEAMQSAEQGLTPDAPDQKDALMRMRNAAAAYQNCRAQLEQVQNAKNQALQYLKSARSTVEQAIPATEAKLSETEASIDGFRKIAGLDFGSAAASQLPALEARRDHYQSQLDLAYELIRKIDNALGEGSDDPQKVLKLR